jgi:thiosulfate/3-mercaptopyruvate sulfurtransferase
MRFWKTGLWIILCGCIAACTRVETPPENVPLEPLISVQTLDSLLQTEKRSIIDVRPEADYLAGHIPGAVNVGRPDLADEAQAVSSITAPHGKLEKLFGRLGIRKEVPVVLYDGKMGADAANLWWIFGLMGKQDVQLLNGGFLAWKAAALPVETVAVTPTPTQVQFSESFDSSHYASLDMVRQALGDTRTVILDTRTFAEFTGEEVKDGAKTGGHIPGSIWMDYTQCTDETAGCFYLRPLATLEAMFREKGVTRDKNIICYCHSGVRSALTTFVLTALLDYPSVRNFDGSWEEWSQDPTVPIETGEGSERSIQ